MLAAVGLVAVLAVGCGGGDDASPKKEAAKRLDEALAAHAEGRISEATKAYREVLDKEPDNKYAHYNLGLIDQQAGRAKQAEKEYRAALAIDANFTSALFNLAILRAPADATEAERLYRTVIGLEPGNASAHLNLGFLLLSKDQQGAGEAELDKAVELDPSLASRVPERDPEEPQEPEDPNTTTTSTP